MSGSLIKINTSTASGNPSVLTVTGIDTTYAVYYLTVKDLIPSSDDTIAWRITKSGTIQTDSEYDTARKDMPTNASFQENSAVDQAEVSNATIESTANGFFANFWLFNFPNSSESSYGVYETVGQVSTPQVFGGNGGFVHKVASATDGISFHFTGGATINNGAELVLYGLNK